MFTNDDIHELSRLKKAIEDAIPIVQKSMQAEAHLKRQGMDIAANEGRLSEGKKKLAEIDEIDQRLLKKRADEAALDAQIARKHEAHGAIAAQLSSLQKQLSKNLEDVAA
jgi:type I site-specific restriction endonuclease